MPDDTRHDCALACSYVILHMLQTSPGATEEEMLSIITDSVLEAIHSAESLIGGLYAALPSEN